MGFRAAWPFAYGFLGVRRVYGLLAQDPSVWPQLVCRLLKA